MRLSAGTVLQVEVANLGLVTTFRLAGVEVPRIGLGTNRLTTASEHVRFIRDAVAAGVRHIDTAHLYTGGESERAIGEALDGTAEEVLVATKGGFRAGEGRPGSSASRSSRACAPCAAMRSACTTCTASIPRPRSRTASARSRGTSTAALSATSASPR